MNYIITKLIEATTLEDIDRILRADLLGVEKHDRNRISDLAERAKRRVKNND